MLRASSAPVGKGRKADSPGKSRKGGRDKSPGFDLHKRRGRHEPPEPPRHIYQTLADVRADELILDNPLLATDLDDFTNNRDPSSGLKSLNHLELSDLIKLKVAFEEADNDGSGVLDLLEFANAFQRVLGVSISELKLLFMRIDANCDGSVTWDEFLSYMLCQDEAAAEALDLASKIQYSHPKMTDALYDINCHAEPMFKIMQLHTTDGYASVSNEGSVFVWSQDTIDHSTQPHGSKADLPWITSAHYLEQTARGDTIALGAADSTLAIYEIHYDKFKLDGRIRLAHTPVSMACFVATDEVKYFAVGDDAGGVSLFRMRDLIEVANRNLGNTDNKGLPIRQQKAGIGGALEVYLQIHKDWITKIGYADDMKLLITCSSDGAIILTDVDRRSTRYRLIGHRKGVNCFIWCGSQQFLASAGLERYVNIWQVTIKDPVFTLEGHQAPIHDLVLHEGSDQLFSLDTEKTVKVWDVRTYKCLQTVQTDAFHPEFAVRCIIYDARRRCLLTGSKKLLSWQATNAVLPKGHSSEICAALYNETFGLVVSGDAEGTVRIWDAATGLPVFRFTQTHGTAKLTAMTFDTAERRLITGAGDGTIKVWNFSTGACLKEAIHDCSTDVTQVCHCVNGNVSFLMAVGWNRTVTLWPDYKDNPEPTVEAGMTMRGHQDDILCAAYHPPAVAVTGASDGNIMVWNVESGYLKFKCFPPGIHKRPSDERAIECVKFVRSGPALLFVATGGFGCLAFWKTQGKPCVLNVSAGHAPHVPIVTLAVHSDDGVLVTGDTTGWIKVRDVSLLVAGVNDPPLVTDVVETAFFRAHREGGVTSLQWVSTKKLILTASGDCTVGLWTPKGERMGLFGLESTWKLPPPPPPDKNQDFVAPKFEPLFKPPDSLLEQKKSFVLEGARGEVMALKDSKPKLAVDVSRNSPPRSAEYVFRPDRRATSPQGSPRENLPDPSDDVDRESSGSDDRSEDSEAEQARVAREEQAERSMLDGLLSAGGPKRNARSVTPKAGTPITPTGGPKIFGFTEVLGATLPPRAVTSLGLAPPAERAATSPAGLHVQINPQSAFNRGSPGSLMSPENFQTPHGLGALQNTTGFTPGGSFGPQQAWQPPPSLASPDHASAMSPSTASPTHQRRVRTAAQRGPFVLQHNGRDVDPDTYVFEVERILECKARIASQGDFYSPSGALLSPKASVHLGNVAHRLSTKAIVPVPKVLPALEHRQRARTRAQEKAKVPTFTSTRNKKPGNDRRGKLQAEGRSFIRELERTAFVAGQYPQFIMDMERTARGHAAALAALGEGANAPATNFNTSSHINLMAAGNSVAFSSADKPRARRRDRERERERERDQASATPLREVRGARDRDRTGNSPAPHYEQPREPTVRKRWGPGLIAGTPTDSPTTPGSWGGVYNKRMGGLSSPMDGVTPVVPGRTIWQDIQK